MDHLSGCCVSDVTHEEIRHHQTRARKIDIIAFKIYNGSGEMRIFNKNILYNENTNLLKYLLCTLV